MLLQGTIKLLGRIDPTRPATRIFQSMVPRFEPLNGDDDIFQKVTSVCIGPASRFPMGAGATLQTKPLAIKQRPIVGTNRFIGTDARNNSNSRKKVATKKNTKCIQVQ